MTRDIMFSGESKNIEYKLTLPDKSEKSIKTIVAFANSQGRKADHQAWMIKRIRLWVLMMMIYSG